MFIVDFVQLFARGSVPMVKTAISIGRNDDILGDTGSVQWSPSDVSGWHRFNHVLIECVTALSSEHIVDLDSTITFTGSNVLVVPVKAH